MWNIMMNIYVIGLHNLTLKGSEVYSNDVDIEYATPSGSNNLL